MGVCDKCGKRIKGTSSAYLMSQRSEAYLKHDRECIGKPTLGKDKQ